MVSTASLTLIPVAVLLVHVPVVLALSILLPAAALCARLIAPRRAPAATARAQRLSKQLSIAKLGGLALAALRIQDPAYNPSGCDSVTLRGDDGLSVKLEVGPDGAIIAVSHLDGALWEAARFPHVADLCAYLDHLACAPRPLLSRS